MTSLLLRSEIIVFYLGNAASTFDTMIFACVCRIWAAQFIYTHIVNDNITDSATVTENVEYIEVKSSFLTTEQTPSGDAHVIRLSPRY